MLDQMCSHIKAIASLTMPLLADGLSQPTDVPFVNNPNTNLLEVHGEEPLPLIPQEDSPPQTRHSTRVRPPID